jgi:hypothetical protein
MQGLSRSEMLGIHIQNVIYSAKVGETIELPDEKMEVSSLIINKPVTLLGKPGSSFMVNGGTIVVNFSHNQHEEEGSASLSKILQKQNYINSS